MGKAEKMMNPLVTVTPLKYIDALLILNGELKDKGIEWALGGDLGEALRTVHVEPDCIEVITSKEGAQNIHQAVKEHQPQEVEERTETLPRAAFIFGKEYPVKTRCSFFEFKINSVSVKVYGDLRYQIADWEWGDKIEFNPDYIYVISQKIPVTPLIVKYELYMGLGWKDRTEKIWQVLARGRPKSSIMKKK